MLPTPKRFVIEEKDGIKRALDTKTNHYMSDDKCPEEIANEICEDFNNMYEFLEDQRCRVRGIKRIKIK